MSFTEFILRYIDKWNISLVVLAEEIGVKYTALLSWMYYRSIPRMAYQKLIEEYFGSEFDGVVFDRKKYRKVTIITAPDGTVEKFLTNTAAYTKTIISAPDFYKYKWTNEPIPEGSAKGYLISYTFEEVE